MTDRANWPILALVDLAGAGKQLVELLSWQFRVSVVAWSVFRVMEMFC